MHTREVLIDKLTRALSPTDLEIVDDSAKHRGHAGAAGGGGHFQARIVAAAFEGKGQVARHRMVYEILAAEMAGPVHALALVTQTPAEAASMREASRVSDRS